MVMDYGLWEYGSRSWYQENKGMLEEPSRAAGAVVLSNRTLLVVFLL